MPVSSRGMPSSQTRRFRRPSKSGGQTRIANEARVREFSNNNTFANLPTIPTKSDFSHTNSPVPKSAHMNSTKVSRMYPYADYDATIVAQIAAAYDTLDEMLAHVRHRFCVPLTPEERDSFSMLREKGIQEANQYVKTHATRLTPVAKAARLHARSLIRFLKREIVFLLRDPVMTTESKTRFLYNMQCILFSKQLELMFHNVE